MDFSRMDSSKLEEELIAFRRVRHRRPENAWTEFLTTCAIIDELKKLGISYIFGREIHTKGERYGVPSDRAGGRYGAGPFRRGADPELVEKMRGGYTGVVGIIDTGRPGPVTAIRFDIDCNDVDESADPAHLPVQEGFASVHPKLMHACGHDAPCRHRHRRRQNSGRLSGPALRQDQAGVPGGGRGRPRRRLYGGQRHL